MASSTFTVSRDLQVIPPESEIGIVVPQSQWNRLTTRIENCGESLDWHWAIGWTAIGVAVTSLVSAITLYASVRLQETVTLEGSTVTTPNMPAVFALVACVILAIAAGCIAVCALIYSTKSVKHGESLRRIIVEDMIELAKVQNQSSGLYPPQSSNSFIDMAPSGVRLSDF